MLKRLRTAYRDLGQSVARLGTAQRRRFVFCAVCLSLYVAYACYLAQSGFLASASGTVAALVWFALIAAGVCCLLLFGCVKLAGAAPRASGKDANAARFFAASVGLSLIILLCAYAAAYPGGVTYDASNQWRQAQSGEYNNWHPVFHTLLVWLGSRLGGYSVVLLLQIVFFALAMGCFACTVRGAGAPAWAVLVVQALCVGCPLVRCTLMTVGKDAAMCIGALCLFAQCLKMLKSGGEWLRRPINAVCFGLLLAFVSLVRHNGVLLALPMLLIAVFCFPARRGAALAAGAAACLMLLVRVPLYGALDIVYPGNTLEEAVGLPMTVMADIKQASPERLDARANALLDSLADEDEWRNVYKKGSYNSIKFTFPRELIARRDARELLSVAAQAALSNPRSAFNTVNDVCDLVWGVTGKNEGVESVGNTGDIEEARYGSARLNALGGAALGFIDAAFDFAPVAWLYKNIGVQQLLLLLVTLWALYRGGVSRLVFALPALCYNLATMLLLCGNDARFFMYFMACAPLATLSLMYLPASGASEAGELSEKSK